MATRKSVPKDFDYRVWDTAFSFCSATLIAPTVILTAAHCLRTEEKYYRHPMVVFGKKSMRGKGSGLRIRVKDFRVNPYYSPKSHYGDVGLAFLAEPVTSIKPMKISDPETDPEPTFGDVVASAGWGTSSRTEIFAQYGYMGPDLKVAWGHAAGPTACQRKAPLIQRDQLCTTGKGRWGSVCYGDSGGPLVLLDDSGKEVSSESWKLPPQRLIGVNSAVVYPRKGQGCTHKAIDVFQSMGPNSPFNKWVRSVLTSRGISI